jgi:RNA polymerase sigma factor (sigma-70 family)
MGRKLMATVQPEVLRTALQSRHGELMAYATRQLPAELRSTVDPADVVQDVFCVAIRRAAEFVETDSTSWSRWLMTIAKLQILDLLRRHRVSRRLGQAPSEHDSVELLLEEAAVYDRTPSASAASSESRLVVAESLARLAPNHAEALRWRYFDGLSHVEVASRTGRSEDAVRKMCAYALAAFGREIGRILSAA